MTNYYVAKDGNDGNSGASWALAKLTVQAGVNLLATGDTLYIGPGTYYEAVTRAISISVTIQGSGYVIMDGNGVLATAFTMNGVTSGTFTLNLNDIIIKNYTSAGLTGGGNISGNTYNVNRCVFRNCLYGIYGVVRFVNLNVLNCIFHDNTAGILYSAAINGTWTISYCTFADNVAGFKKTGTTTTLISIKHCVLSNNSRHYDFVDTTGTTITLNYNDVWFDGTTDSNWGGTAETTLAGWRTTSSKDANSVSEDPVFQDRLKKAYGLHKTTALYADIVEGGDLGAGYQQTVVTVGMSYNDPDGNWDNMILSDCVVNAGNNIETDSTEGYVRTGVIDLGAKKQVRRINIRTTLDKNKYPANVPDYDDTDVQPKRMSFRWRGSESAFAAGDGSPAWSEIEPSAVGEDVNTLCRYVQVEAHLRTDGT